MAHEVYLGFGANLGDRARSISRAVQLISGHAEIETIAMSHLYETSPVGYTDQPPFLNAVGRFHTSLSCREILRVAMETEEEIGRKPRGKWMEREIDIDLLLCGDETVDSGELQLPHPGLHTRLFVLRPLAEIAPEVILPGGGTAAEVAEKIAAAGDEQVVLYHEQIVNEE